MLMVFCCDLVMSPALTYTAILVKCQEHDLTENVSHSVVTTARCPPNLHVSGQRLDTGTYFMWAVFDQNIVFQWYRNAFFFTLVRSSLTK